MAGEPDAQPLEVERQRLSRLQDELRVERERVRREAAEEIARVQAALREAAEHDARRERELAALEAKLAQKAGRGWLRRRRSAEADATPVAARAGPEFQRASAPPPATVKPVDDEAAAREAQLAALQAELEAKQRELARRQEELRDREEELAARERRLREAEQRLDEAERGLAALRAELAEHERLARRLSETQVLAPPSPVPAGSTFSEGLRSLAGGARSDAGDEPSRSW